MNVVSPMGEKEGLNIHQHAWFHLGKLDKDFSTTYELKDKTNGVYAFVIDGDVTINGEKLNRRMDLVFQKPINWRSKQKLMRSCC